MAATVGLCEEWRRGMGESSLKLPAREDSSLKLPESDDASSSGLEKEEDEETLSKFMVQVD